MTRTVSIGLLAIALLVASPMMASADTAPSDTDAVSTGDAMAFRSLAGLQADSATVDQSLTDASVYSDTRFGVPLTPAEADNVRAQIAAQNDLDGTAQAATELPDFASKYFVGPTLHVLVTGDAETARLALDKVKPASGDLVISQSKVDARTLEETAAAVRSDPDLARLNITPSKVAIDPVAPRVEVTLLATEATADAARLLQHTYGDLVVVLTTPDANFAFACLSRHNCGTKGGLTIEHLSPDNGCTSGFVGKNTSFGGYFMITAGHCIQESGGQTNLNPWKNGVGNVTYGINSSYQLDAHMDMGSFYISGASIPSIKNQYYAGGPSDIRTIRTTAATDSQMTVGKYVCRTGRTSNWDCGLIHRANISATITIIQYGLWEVSMRSAHGDSGAGVIGLEQDDTYVIPFGILLGGDATTYTYYYPAHYSNGATGVSICTSAAC